MDKQKMIAREEMQHNHQMQHHHQPPSGGGDGGSTAASPSHEFSFTVSLNPTTNPTKSPVLDKKIPSSFAIDLSPADDIFFHGHLLPLHLLSTLPVSPRTSTNSIDLLEEKNTRNPSRTLHEREMLCARKLDHDDDYYDLNHSFHYHHQQTNSFTTTKGDQEKPKSKSFSLFGLPRWKHSKIPHVGSREGEMYESVSEKDPRIRQDKEKQSKLKFDVSQVLKRYMRMVRPFLSFRSRGKDMEFGRHRQSYSFSFRGKKESISRGIKRGAYSAPVSMKNSPTNSGLLVATPTNNSSSSSSESTMEELQAAIQAAIAHCKKSSSMDPKIKCQENLQA